MTTPSPDPLARVSRDSPATVNRSLLVAFLGSLKATLQLSSPGVLMFPNHKTFRPGSFHPVMPERAETLAPSKSGSRYAVYARHTQFCLRAVAHEKCEKASCKNQRMRNLHGNLPMAKVPGLAVGSAIPSGTPASLPAVDDNLVVQEPAQVAPFRPGYHLALFPSLKVTSPLTIAPGRASVSTLTLTFCGVSGPSLAVGAGDFTLGELCFCSVGAVNGDLSSALC